MRVVPGNDLILGHLAGRSATLGFSRTERDKHLYVCGSTGTGKSKFLESLIRQDILAWHKSHCGMLVLDPHGSLYDSLINWLAWRDQLERPIIPIDLRQEDWVVSYNPLRPRPEADPAVIVSNVVQAMAHVWGESNTTNTPLFARWASNVLWALYEKKLTLVEAEHLISRTGKRLRYAMTHDLSIRSLTEDWAFANTLSPEKFDTQIGSTANRLRSFLSTQMLRRIFGQTGPSLDLGDALRNGSIILVNLATERARISDEESSLFATLLLSDLWTAAKERGKGMDARDVKPFYVYVDEFQNFLTPTIAKNLAQARGFGLHLTLANQFPRQILHGGAHGPEIYDSVIATARNKVVFETTGEENLRPLALDLFRGVMNPDEIKHELYSTKVIAYREEIREVRSEGTSSGSGRGMQTGSASGAGLGGGDVFFPEQIDPRTTSASWSDFAASSESESESDFESSSQSKSFVPTIVPVLGKELSHVQFRSLDEQLSRAMATLSDQKQRQGVVRLVGMKAPASIATPTVNKKPGTAERAKRYLKSRYAKLPFALLGTDAQKRLGDRAENFEDDMLRGTKDAVIAVKRRIR